MGQSLENLFAGADQITLQRGDLLYREGEEPKGIFRLKSGLLALLKVSAKGQEHLLRLFRPGQILGHRSLLAMESYHASAACIEPAKIEFINKSDFFARLESQHETAFTIMAIMARELRGAEIRSLVVTDSEVLARVASTLLFFKNIYPDHLWTRKEIANYCASRTPTVIKALGQLEDKGLIEQKGREIRIRDAEGLAELADELDLAL